MSSLCLLSLVPPGSQADNYQVNNNFAMNAQPLDQFVIFAVKVRDQDFLPKNTKEAAE